MHKGLLPTEIIEETLQFLRLWLSKAGLKKAVEVDVGEFTTVDPADARALRECAEESVDQKCTHLGKDDSIEDGQTPVWSKALAVTVQNESLNKSWT